MLNVIEENRQISRLAGAFPRSPLQLNHLHESDSELLAVPHVRNARLALTTDTIAEEIESGLYSDPWLIGWMTVMVNLSDLAAVGATPLGLLVAETLPADAAEGFVQELQQGIADACRTCATYVLGGDTNSGPALSMTATAIGLVEDGRLLTRLGCLPGEAVFVSGRVGGGSAYAHAKLTGSPLPPYRPCARLREGHTLRRWATCCMDTSDGLLAALDQLMRLNNAGFTLDPGWESSLTDPARALARRLGVPDWFTIAGEHGEFELVFTVSDEKVPDFLMSAEVLDWRPLRIGSVIPAPEILLPSDNGPVCLNTAGIRNLAATSRRDAGSYVKSLLEMAGCRQCPTDS